MNFSSLTVAELKKIAKEKEITGVSKLRKADLVLAIKKSLKSQVTEKPPLIDSKIKGKSYTSVVKKPIEAESKIILLKEKINDPKWITHKKEIDEILKKLEQKFSDELKKEKEIFIKNGGNEIDFHFMTEEKNELNRLSFDYRKIKRLYFKELENQKKINSELKKSIIEDIKKLIGSDESINTIYKKFKSLQESWHKTGPALRSESNNLWETYKHHVERFYDFLHINRELRNKDYEHNYVAKKEIIKKAEDLVNISDIIKAGRELNILHRLWKNDLGPVLPKKREILWKRFQDASKAIHAKRQDFQKNIEKNQSLNFVKKNEILQKIKKLIDPEPLNHKEWQSSIREFNVLRDEFKSIGRIPKSKNKKNWNLFREAGREFNLLKNKFYKTQKNNQKETIGKYENLIEEVKSINEKEDWKNHSGRMKSIQIDFNNLSFIPRRLIKKFRNEFQRETNLYFHRLKTGYQKLNNDEEILYKKKVELINNITLEKAEDNFDIENYKKYWDQIDEIGVLNNLLTSKIINLFIKSVSKSIKTNTDLKDSKSSILFEIELYCLKSSSNDLQIKIDFHKKTIDGLQTEITQLENNLEFFSKSSNESPLLKEVTSKLNILTTNLFKLKERNQKLQSTKKNLINLNKEEEEESNITNESV